MNSSSNNAIELSVKYHKISVFVVSFAKHKFAKELGSGFRNPKLRTIAKPKKLSFARLGQGKVVFPLFHQWNLLKNMVWTVGHPLFLSSQSFKLTL